MFVHHYNAVTAENAMKPINITSAKGVYNFAEADKIVALAGNNKLKMIGHTLIWHRQSADWLNKNPDGTPLNREKARANMEEFIKTYVGRYSGKIYSWDVINEVFVDSDEEYSGNWKDYLRRDAEKPGDIGFWTLAYENGAANDENGADFIFDAYFFARRSDLKAILYYNDYNTEFPTKCKAIAEMVEEINAKWCKHPEYDGRLLIEGIGMQGHYNMGTNINDVRKSIERFVKTGALLAVTEIDLTVGSEDNPAIPITHEQSKAQAQFYKALFLLFTEYSTNIERVTMWGKNDKQSWRSWGSPTFFDKNGKAKEALFAILHKEDVND